MATGRIFNIQRYSTHDGPGIRTTVFMKGCNLRCAWCHNPESLSASPTLEFNSELCIGCGRCAQVCPNGVHKAGQPAAYREACAGCGACARECFAGALTLAGTDMDAAQAMEEILTDLPYFRESGGGVTFSGGECMLQIDFLEEVCRRCREAGVPVAIDTAGCVPWARFERLLPYASLFLYDMKARDARVHRRLTGADNGLLLENLERLLSAGARVWIRVPCVPGGNDGELQGIAEWLRGRPVERVELLAYHRLGGGKRALLGLAAGQDFSVPTDDDMKAYLQHFIDRGVNARIG
ncbi:MAG: glycyl-radical enzyme activating protein [Clostridia bacterium]|nr:glycyl-radical enzyme activating protein [Clostridia bacterium]